LLVIDIASEREASVKKRLLLILSVLVIMAIAVGLLAHFVFVSPVASIKNKSIGANVSMTGSNVPTGIKAVVPSVHSPFARNALSNPDRPHLGLGR